MGNRCLAPCALLVALAGCGPSQATVRGKVTYQEKPLTSGEVHLVGGSGPSRSALITPQGTFEIHNAPIGQVAVAVVSFKSPGPPKVPTATRIVVKEIEEVSPRLPAIPTKYGDIKTSGLVFTISPGRQSLDIELKD